MVCVAAAVACAPSVRAQYDMQQAETQQVRNLLDSYVQSIDRADTSLADRIFSHSNGVVFISPARTQHGVKEIESGFYQKVMAHCFSTRELVVKQPVIYVNGHTAWSEFNFTFSGVVKSTGKIFTMTGSETQVYRKEDGRWRIVLAHHSESA